MLLATSHANGVNRGIVAIEVSRLKQRPSIQSIFDELSGRDYEALKNDIAEHGIKTALQILPDNTVVCGHQRLRAARELGLSAVPCQVMELRNDVEVQDWAIKDNLLRRQLTPEQRYLLYAKLSEIYEVGRGGDRRSGDFQRCHSDIFENGDVLARTAKEVGESPGTIARARTYKRAIEEMPELRGKGSASSVLNEYQRRKELENRKRETEAAPDLKNLLLGDALERIEEIPDNSVDLLFTDPPYGRATVGVSGRGQSVRMKGSEWCYPLQRDPSIFAVLDKFFEKAARKLKEDAHVYIFTNWRSLGELISAVEKHLTVKNCIVNHFGVSLGTRDNSNYRNSYNLILFAAKGGRRKLGGLWPSNHVDTRKMTIRNHPAEKSLETCEMVIKNSTVEGETVLDPFAGSGTTLVAAEKLKRNWFGIEIDPHWHGVAKARILESRKSDGGVANAEN